MSASVQAQRIRQNAAISFDAGAFGTYVKCDLHGFSGVKERPDRLSIPEWRGHFRYLFNYVVCERIAKGLCEWPIKSGPRLAHLAGDFFDSSTPIPEMSLGDLAAHMKEGVGRAYEEFWRDLPTHSRLAEPSFLHAFWESLGEAIPELAGKRLVILLDEFYRLSDYQQQVVNGIIRLRSPEFKVSTLPYGFVLIDEEMSSLEPGQDIEVVEFQLERLSSKDRNFSRRRDDLRRIVEHRLSELCEIHVDLRKTLPPYHSGGRVLPRGKGPIHRFGQRSYTGVDNLVVLTSGNTKFFLDLVEGILNQATSEGHDISRTPVPTWTQYKTVKAFSEDYFRRACAVGSPGPLKFIEMFTRRLGQEFRKHFLDSQRPSTLIGIRNPAGLPQEAQEGLAHAFRTSLFLPAQMDRYSRDGFRLQTFTLHPILLPNFDLPLEVRNVTELEAEDILKMLEEDGMTQPRASVEPESVPPSSGESPVPFGIDEFPELLRDQAARGELVLFIGSGLSIDAGAPTTRDICTHLGSKLPTKVREGTLPSVALDFENRYSRSELLQEVESLFKDRTLEPTEAHLRLADLLIHTIFTTNYDELIEEALKRKGSKFRKIVRLADIQTAPQGVKQVWKIHGDFTAKDQLVITERDYDQLFKDRPFIVSHLSDKLASLPFAFIGYSMSDPDFKNIEGKVWVETGGQRRTMYFVSPRISKADAELWRARGYKPIQMDGRTFLGYLARR
jgi:hypothetical protein